MKTTPKIFLCLDQDGWTKGFQLCIKKEGGSGFRLAGPKYNGSSKRLQTVEITVSMADEIRTYLAESFP